jgi:parallel beta-helix repeat protein
MNAIRAATALLLITVCPLVLAAEGRRPIFGITTITKPGKYIVVRNIGTPTCGSGDPTSITIASSNVDVDLNGFTLYCGEPVIDATSVSNVIVHNGIIQSYEESIVLTDVTRFAIREVVASSGEDCAIGVMGSSGGVIEDSLIQTSVTGICVDADSKAITIRRNEVNGYGIGMRLSGEGCHVYENTAYGGIDLQGSDNRLKDNVLHGDYLGGIQVTGSRNQIEDNLMHSAPFAFGLYFAESSSDNVYRGNTARGNNGSGCTNPVGNKDFCDYGTGNTSRGDNFLPGWI